jgi:parallel beta helix pectate lyase-like protein
MGYDPATSGEITKNSTAITLLVLSLSLFAAGPGLASLGPTPTPLPTSTPTFTPTPMPTPNAIFQREELDLLSTSDQDIDAVWTGNEFTVYVPGVDESDSYIFQRKTGSGGSWEPISQTPDYDSGDLEGYYFTEPDTLSAGHYYYKVSSEGCSTSSCYLTDDDGGEDWRGGIVVNNKTIYVDKDANGDDDGTSWEDAYTTIQDGIDDSLGGDRIWVKTGTYEEAIGITVSELEIYGGFAGDETYGSFDLDTRSFQHNETTIEQVGSDPAVTIADQEDVVVDGFTIAGGDGTTGGGVSASSAGNLEIANCVIRDNEATKGGGCGFSNSHATLTNCLLHGNSCTGYGGAVYLEGEAADDTEVTLTNCTLADNLTTPSRII